MNAQKALPTDYSAGVNHPLHSFSSKVLGGGGKRALIQFLVLLFCCWHRLYGENFWPRILWAMLVPDAVCHFARKLFCSGITSLRFLLFYSIYCKTQFTSRQHNNNINHNSISINTQLICYMFRLFLSHHQTYTSRTTVFPVLSYSFLSYCIGGSLLHYKS